MITVEEKIFNVTTIENNIEVVPVEQETVIVEVNASIPGAKGENATINGLNTLEIVAGENIEIEQEEGTLTVNATATPQIQSDWSEVDNTKKSYIKNKITKLSELENDIEETDPIYTADKPNIALKSEIPAVQIQSDLAQEDDTQVDYVKNKHANYITTTLYEEGEEGEQIPVYEGTVEEVLNLYLSMINETYESLSDQIDRKQDSLEDIQIMIERSQWTNNECLKYISQINSDDKVWYSPTEYSYNDFINAEIRMTEQGSGYVKFKCETTPEEDINIIIRRA